MNEEIYKALIQVARKQTVIHYSDLAMQLGLNMDLPQDRVKIGQILDDINFNEHSNERPLISAVVVHKGSLRPGEGFFKMAKDWNIFKGNDSDFFYIQELRKVHDHWRVQ
jgi:hypothetical protein